MVGAETLLQAMGYKAAGSGRLALDAPVCPDMVAAVSRDAIIAQCECQVL
jgi:spermatogenesis-associated protein 2